MVNASELRIGNWAVNYGNYVCIEADDIVDCHQQPECYDPIALTPEILEKVGFKYDGGMESYDLVTSSGLISIATDYSFFIGDNHLECGFAGGNKSLVKYLHQLQNLVYALTGEELQIEL